MNNDITFCANECGNTDCQRNKDCYLGGSYPVSWSHLKGTDYCEGYIEPKEETP